MFAQMAQQLLQRHEPGAELNSVDLDSYLEWQRNYTFDALQNIRYGQSFCNHFDIRDNRIFYDRDWVRCDVLIRKEWLSRP